MQKTRYIVIEKFSVRPSKVVIYNEFTPVSSLGSSFEESMAKNEFRESLKSKKDPSLVLSKSFHNFELSVNATRNLRDKINWLFQLAKSRYVKTYSGREIYNFKICFLTLTLPSVQMHPTSKITSDLFNHFLTEIKQRTKMENFVWRLEFQKNGNVHYHLVTDTFIDYHFSQKIWNRICEKLGYVTAFATKMESLSLQDYYRLYHQEGKDDFNLLAKRYAKGKAEKWQNPPSVDVKSASNENTISAYISKYFSKKSSGGSICNALDTVENSFALRLWFCSRSLSKLKSISDYSVTQCVDWHNFFNGVERANKVFFEYCTVIYFDIRKVYNEGKAYLYQLFRSYSSGLGYVPAH